MQLSNREKIIAIAVVASLGLYVADWYLLEPYLAAQAQMRTDLSTVTRKLKDADDLVIKGRKADTAFAALVTRGLQKSAPDSQSQTLHALDNWAQSARVEMQSLKPDRVTQVGDFQEIRFAALGSGPMANISRLLWSIETSPLPLRVVELRLAARKEGTDDLLMQLNVSTIVYAPPPEKTAARVPAKEAVE